MCGCQSEHALSQWPSHANSSYETKIVGGCYNARQSLSSVDAFEVVFWSSQVAFIPSPLPAVAFVDKMAEQMSRDRSSSTEAQLKFPGCTHYRRRSDNHYRCQQCRLNEGLTLCTEDSPCEVCKDWLLEAWLAQEKAIEQKRKRKAAAAVKAAKKSQERDVLDDSVEIYAPEDALQLPPTKHKSDGSSKSKRAKTATGSGSKAMELAGLPGPVIRRRPYLHACQWWNGPSPMEVPGPRGRSAIGHGVESVVGDLMDPTDTMTLQGPIIHPDTTVDVERVGSGPGPGHWVGPAPGGRLSLWMLRV